MSAPSPGKPTAFRLARITALVLGSLLFLYACERSKSAVLSDVWVEVGIALAFGVGALAAAWFEITLRAQDPEHDTERAEAPFRGNSPSRSRLSEIEDYPEHEQDERTGRATRSVPMAALGADGHSEPADHPAHRGLAGRTARTLRGGGSDAADEQPLLSTWHTVTKWVRRAEPDTDADLDDHDEIEQITRTETGELLVESSTRTIRAKIARSGDLVLHGRAIGDPRPPSEWRWSFQPDVFASIRAVLGNGSGDLLDLLEETIPWLDADARYDPGAWLRAHDIPATYREKGVSASQITRELQVLRPGHPPQQSGNPPRQAPRGAPRTRNPGVAAPETAAARPAHPRSDYAADARPSPRESHRRRNLYAPPDSESRTGRRAQTERPRPDRFTSLSQAAERPASASRRNGDQWHDRSSVSPEPAIRRDW
ncbi:hypothetical protein [Nocardia sp. R6R-6]|uniref:hypothetical protein n=1 Tax=Nocardia sp. R6R-6 TaxID=3459303 RepID=UPI00403E1F31